MAAVAAVGRVDLAIVLVHGVGDTAPGDVLKSADRALTERFGLKREESALSPAQPPPEASARHHARVTTAVFRQSSRRIAVTEFNWATVPGKVRLRRPLAATRMLLEMLGELPRLGATKGDKRLWRIACWAGAFQRWLMVALLLATAAATVEIALRPELLDWVAGTEQSLAETAPAVSSGLAMIPNPLLRAMSVIVGSPSEMFARQAFCTLAVSLLYWLSAGNAALAMLWVYLAPAVWLWRRKLPVMTLWRALVASSIVVAAASAVTVDVLLFAVVGVSQLRRPTDAGFAVQDLLGSGVLLAVVGYVLLRILVIVVNLVRDVVHYIADDTNRAQIVRELDGLLANIEKNGARRVVVVAHSLGTAIVTDMIAEHQRPPAGDPTAIDLVTAGSPLRRLLARLVPGRRPAALVHAKLVERGAIDRWFNYYRLFDYVGQALTYSALPLDLLGWKRRRGDGRTTICDQLLTPRLGRRLAHTGYWGDPRFLKAIAEDVVAPALAEDPHPAADGFAG